jgi:small subunit ribosomal protein S16
MVMIRLARIGKKKHPTYRFIASDKRKDTKGTYLESLGHYNPHTTPITIEINKDRLAYWLKVGAGMSDTVHNLFVTQGIIKAEKRDTMHKKKVVEATEAPKEAKVEPAAAAPAA